MSAVSYFRKKILGMIGALVVAFILFCCGYAAFLSNVQTVSLQTSFFYLVTDDAHIEVGAEFVKLEGGAGYLLRYNGRDYVVLSVYLRETDGIAVQTALLENGKKTELLHVGVNALHFKSIRDKKNGGMYVEALQIMHSYMSVLNECIARLEKGMTQEACKRILTPLEHQFSFLSDEYGRKYPKFADVCKQAAYELSALSSQTLYVKDLRYLLCVLSEKYVALASTFSL